MLECAETGELPPSNERGKFRGSHLTCSGTQLCPILCDPMDYSLQTPLSMGFFRQEYWSGLPFPSPASILKLYLGVISYDTCWYLSPFLHLEWSPCLCFLWLDLELFPISLWSRNIALCIYTLSCIHLSVISSVSLLPRCGYCTSWSWDSWGSHTLKNFFSSIFMPRCGIAGSSSTSVIFFKWTSMCSPYWMNLCTLQSTVQDGSLVSALSLAFILFKIILFIYLWLHWVWLLSIGFLYPQQAGAAL